jgi:glycosyltransferase involved in cell wall biosynthesis
VYLAVAYPHARGVKWIRAWEARGVGHRIFHGGSDHDVWHGKENSTVISGFKRKWQFRLAPMLRQIRRALDSEAETLIAVVCRDIFLARIGRMVADTYHVPLVLDVCDNYPEVALQLSRFGRPWLRFAAPMIERVERAAISAADHVVCVTEESRSHIAMKQQGVHRGQTGEDFRSKSHVVENVPWIETEPVWNQLQETEGLVYIGTFDAGIRDLDTVLEGLIAYEKRFDERIALTIYTFDSAELRKSLDRRFASWADFINVRPPVPAADLPAVLAGHMGGLVPHHRGPGTDYTISNKIFDYLWAGIPVLASDNPPNVRVLRETSGGIIYRGEDPDHFTVQLRKLNDLRMSPSVRADPEVLRDKFSWDSQVYRVIDEFVH